MSHGDRVTLERAVTPCRNLAKQLTALNFDSYSSRDGSLRGLNGNAGIGLLPIELRLPPQL
jgi:hypothetical protein